MTTRGHSQHSTSVKTLRPGQSLGVSDNGKPSFTAKAGKRSRRTLAELQRRARAICPTATPKVNFTQALRELNVR